MKQKYSISLVMCLFVGLLFGAGPSGPSSHSGGSIGAPGSSGGSISGPSQQQEGPSGPSQSGGSISGPSESGGTVSGPSQPEGGEVSEPSQSENQEVAGPTQQESGTISGPSSEQGEITGPQQHWGTILPPNTARREQLLQLVLSAEFARARQLLHETHSLGLSADEIVTKYQDAVRNFFSAYQNAGVSIVWNNEGNYTVGTFTDLGKLCANRFEKLGKDIAEALRTNADYTGILQELMDVLDRYDTSMNALASELAGGDASAQQTILTLYKKPRNTVIFAIFNNLLNMISQATTGYTDEILERAKSYVQYCDDSWQPDLIVTGFQTATQAKSSYNSVMGHIYGTRGQQVSDMIPDQFQSSTRGEMDELFIRSQELFTNAQSRYEQANDMSMKFQMQTSAENAGIQKSSYDIAWDKKSEAEQKGASEALTEKQQAVLLFNNAYEKFQKAGDSFDAEIVSVQLNMLQGDVGVDTGRVKLAEYKQQSEDAAQGEEQSTALAMQCGIVLVDDGMLFSEAALQFQNSLEFYVKAGLSVTQDVAAIPAGQVNLKAIFDAHELITTITKVNGLLQQADTFATQASDVGLQQAERLYTQARQICANADHLVLTDPELLRDMTLYPGYLMNDVAITYQWALNEYIADVYRNTCQPLIESGESDKILVALHYYSSIASHGVDMDAELAVLQSMVDTMNAARQAKAAAVDLSAVQTNWMSQSSDATYESIANSAWQRALNLYQVALESGNEDAQTEVLDVLHEYADAYQQHVPQEYYPLLGAVLMYSQLKQVYQRQNNTAMAQDLETVIAQLINEINTYITSNLSTSIIDQLVAQENYEEALDRQKHLIVYYTQRYPQTNELVLGKTNEEIADAQLKQYDIYQAWGIYKLEQKEYQDAFTYLATARVGYHQLGRDDKANDTTLRRAYFKAETLATAAQIYGLIYTEGTKNVANRFDVPRTYFIRDQVRSIPLGVPTYGDPATCALYTEIAYRLADKGIEYEDAYTPDSTTRTNTLDTDKETIVDMIEQEARAYYDEVRGFAEYQVRFDQQGAQPTIREQNKMISAAKPAYNGAICAASYYVAALQLFRVGTQLVSFNGRNYVPGQDDTMAWNVGKDIAFALISEAGNVQTTLPNLQLANDRTYELFDMIRSAYIDMYTFYVGAYEFLNGKDHQQGDFIGTSLFAADALYMNMIMAQMWSGAAETMKSFIVGTPDTQLFSAAVDEVFQDYMSARQHYVEYYSGQGISNAWSISDSNAVLDSIAQVFKTSGDTCMATSAFYEYAGQYYGGAQNIYQTFIDNGIRSLAGRDLTLEMTSVTQLLYGSYFKVASRNMLAFIAAKQASDVIDGKTYVQLVELYNNYMTGTASMSQEQMTKYSEIEVSLLDALMYFLYTKSMFEGLVGDSTQYSALIQQGDDLLDPPTEDGAAFAAFRSYVTGTNGIELTELDDNEEFQSLVDAGYETFVGNSDSAIRYSLLSLWSWKMYFSLTQTYANAYLAGLSLDQQLVEVNSRISARMTQLSGGAVLMT
ncbi:hypothetical protein JW872_04105 [Candidatus Babeliales bacterium]|nr:hypothetical protein [Candidatus Babeliales bacterium]